jgi:nucleotide-binding universal stress UspA family protein
MRRFKNILYFTDGVAGNCSAFERAVGLTAANDARLTLFDVIPEGDTWAGIEGKPDVNVEKAIYEQRVADLDALVARSGDSASQVRREVVRGIPFVEVIRAVISRGYDLVIKEARPPDSFVKRTLGSTDLHLLRKCPCPIWIDRRNAAFPYRTVLAAVDPADSGYEDSAGLIMDLATSLAKQEAAALAVIHAWRLRGESFLRSRQAEVTEAELDLLLRDKREQHRRRLASLLAKYGMTTDDSRVHLVKGEPAERIRSMSKELEADLVVMGTLGRRGVPGLFIGNTAEDVLQTTQASVLAIKPFGFTSPVTV